MTKRVVEVLVISDVHLGTYGCRAKELLAYLRGVNPKKLILNGDIIDAWQFDRAYFPDSHLEIIHCILNYIRQGTEVCYITGNHDEVFRRFSGFKLSNFSIQNKCVLFLNGKRTWIFHGDVFDITMKHSKWLAKLGGKGYDLLILLNSAVNFILLKLGFEKMSLSKKIKNSVKKAIQFIDNFEKTAIDIAIDNNFDYVVCGHIHQPCIREMNREGKKVVYLNSGDWIENLTALEYNHGTWSLYQFEKELESNGHDILDEVEQLLKQNKTNRKSVLENMMKELSSFIP